MSRKESIENSAIQVLHELEIIDKELSSLGEAKSITAKEVTELNDRISAKKRGDLLLRLGNKEYIVPKEAIENAPFPLSFFFWPIIYYNSLYKWLYYLFKPK